MAIDAETFEVRGRFSHLAPVAVVDIGSNSVRLVIYEGAVRAVVPLFNEKVLCGLGRYVAETGALGREGIDRVLATLSRFRTIVTSVHACELRAVATAAVREASDGETFLREGRQVLGVPIRVLSGEEEAAYAAQGLKMAFLSPDGIVGDLGGGSLEVIDIRAGRATGLVPGGDLEDRAVTLPLGGLRLIEAAKGKPDKAVAIVDKALDQVDWLQHGEGRSFFAVGGTWRSFARLHMERQSYPLHVMQGYRMPIQEVIDLAVELRKSRRIMSVPNIDVVSTSRWDVLPFGATALERLLLRIKPMDVVVSVFGVREGVFYDILSKDERRKDPLISFCTDYARLRSRSPEHALELCTWTDALFNRDDLKETADERRLRRAACLLSDISWRAHPDYRGEQSLNVIAHAALSGIDHPGRMFLAMSVYHRHSGKGSGDARYMSGRMKTVMSRRAHKRAKIIGQAVRAAHMLSTGMAGVVTRTPIAYEGDALVLDIPRDLAGLDGERLRRRFLALAKTLGSRFELRIEGRPVDG